MNQFTEKEVLAAYRKLGLETDADRAKFTQYSASWPLDERQEFILLDNTTQVSEAKNAKLA